MKPERILFFSQNGVSCRWRSALSAAIMLFVCAVLPFLFSSCFEKIQQGLAPASTEETKEFKFSAEEASPPIITSPDPLNPNLFIDGESANLDIRGTSEPGVRLKLYSGNVEVATTTSSSSGEFVFKDVPFVLGENRFRLVTISPSGLESRPTEIAYGVSAPPAPTIEFPSDGEEIRTGADTKVVFVRGRATIGINVEVMVNGEVAGVATADTSGFYEVADVELPLGDVEITVRTISLVENVRYYSAVARAVVKVLKDTVPPKAVNLTGTSNGSNNRLTWTRSPESDFLAYKILRTDPFSNPDISTDDVLATITDVNTTVFEDGPPVPGRAYYYTVWVMDEAENCISSNVLDLPKIVFGLQLIPLSEYKDYREVSRNHYWYSEYELRNTGNVEETVQFDYSIKTYPSGDPNPDSWFVKLWQVGGVYLFESSGIGETAEPTTETTSVTTTTIAGTTTTTMATEKTVEWPYELVEGESTTITLGSGESVPIAVKVFNNNADPGDILTVKFDGYCLLPMAEEQNTIIPEVTTGKIWIVAK